MHIEVRKRLVKRLTYLWPGLPRLWWDGNWVGLVAAFAFAGLINFLLLTTFVWSIPLVNPYLSLGWGLSGLIWVVAAGEAAFADQRQTTEEQGQADEALALFLDAQREYLKGHWFKAEQLLQTILESSPKDADARLLLATLYRRTDRVNLAGEQLDLLQRAGTSKWLMEIEQEKLLLEEQRLEGEEISAAEAA